MPDLTFGRVWRQSKRIVRAGALVVGGILLTAWTVTPVRHRLEDFRWIDENSIAAVVGVLLVVVAAALVETEARVERLTEKVSAFTPAGSVQVIPRGVRDVYPHLEKAIDAVEPKRHRTLDVFGLTLFTAWGRLEPWLASEETKHWRVRLLCISPEFVTSHPSIPNSWAGDARAKIDDVAQFLATRGRELKERKVSIELVEYPFVPALHGFLLGNGELFISFTHWEHRAGEDSLLSRPNQCYVHFSAEDSSVLAREQRALFENWFERAIGPQAGAAT
jgi:hypothetical protein